MRGMGLNPIIESWSVMGLWVLVSLHREEETGRTGPAGLQVQLPSKERCVPPLSPLPVSLLTDSVLDVALSRQHSCLKAVSLIMNFFFLFKEMIRGRRENRLSFQQNCVVSLSLLPQLLLKGLWVSF